MEDKYDKKLKELDRKIRTLKLKKKEDKYKVIKEVLYKNDKYLTENDVEKIKKFIFNILNEKNSKSPKEEMTDKAKFCDREPVNISSYLLKKDPQKMELDELEQLNAYRINEEIVREAKKNYQNSLKKSIETQKSLLEIYLCFEKATEENYEIYAVSSENELVAKEVVGIKYENISVSIKELCCFIEYLKNLNALQKQEELKIVNVSKLYVDNLYIVNNWTTGVVKKNQNEVIKELIPVATALRKEFEELGGELIYVKPKENIARIYYKENIEE